MEGSVQLRAPAALPVEKEATLHIEWGAGWTSEEFWIFWINEEPLADAWNQTRVPCISSP